jgi:hypothetical protein
MISSNIGTQKTIGYMGTSLAANRMILLQGLQVVDVPPVIMLPLHGLLVVNVPADIMLLLHGLQVVHIQPDIIILLHDRR